MGVQLAPSGFAIVPGGQPFNFQDNARERLLTQLSTNSCVNGPLFIPKDLPIPISLSPKKGEELVLLSKTQDLLIKDPEQIRAQVDLEWKPLDQKQLVVKPALAPR